MKNVRFSSKQILIGLGLIVPIVLVRDLNNRMANMHRLTLQKDIVSTQYAAELSTKEALETQVAYAASDDAVEEFAYENGMVQPGDQRIAPVAIEQATPTPNPFRLPTPVPVSNWELWLALFFDPPQKQTSP